MVTNGSESGVMLASDRSSRLSEKSRLRECRAGRGSCQIFTIARAVTVTMSQIFCLAKPAKLACPRHFANLGFQDCTKIWHAAVDELHSIENTRDKIAKNLLTFAVAGVKTHSFLDSFAVTLGRQGLKAEASSLRLLLRERTQKNHYGRQRLLADENARPVEGKTESRGVERSFRLVTSPRFKLNMPCVRQYQLHSPAGTECKSLVENNGPTQPSGFFFDSQSSPVCGFTSRNSQLHLKSTCGPEC